MHVNCRLYMFYFKLNVSSLDIFSVMLLPSGKEFSELLFTSLMMFL